MIHGALVSNDDRLEIDPKENHRKNRWIALKLFADREVSSYSFFELDSQLDRVNVTVDVFVVTASQR